MHEVFPPEVIEPVVVSPKTTVESEVPLIKETDFTQKSLEEIRFELSQRIKSGSVLHGSQRGDLSELLPSTSADSLRAR